MGARSNRDELHVGRVSLSGEELYRNPPFNVSTKRSELIDRLYAIPQVVQTEKNTYPHIPLVALADSTTWDRYFGVVEWAIEQIKRSAARGLQ